MAELAFRLAGEGDLEAAQALTLAAARAYDAGQQRYSKMHQALFEISTALGEEITQAAFREEHGLDEDGRQKQPV